MFKMQADNHNHRENIATDKKYVLRKMVWSLKTLNSIIHAT